MKPSDHQSTGDQSAGDESRAGSGALAGRRSPKQPDAQRSDPTDESGVSPDGTETETDNDAQDDETSDERYRDSPGAAIDETSGDVPEPNEPG